MTTDTIGDRREDGDRDSWWDNKRMAAGAVRPRNPEPLSPRSSPEQTPTWPR